MDLPDLAPACFRFYTYGEPSWMSRTLTLLFRRDPTKDRPDERVPFEGYQAFWPDGHQVEVGLDAFCKHGQRLLGLGKQLEGSREKLIKMICFPLRGREDDLNRLPGHRVRRFFIERTGSEGRIHFMDGTPTTVIFNLNRDEQRLLHWIGLTTLPDGQRLWFDLAATAAESAAPLRFSRLVPCEV
jgi:hypothetical protein